MGRNVRAYPSPITEIPATSWTPTIAKKMITYTELKKSLRSENLSSLYLLLGPEEFLARRLVSQITKLALGDGLKDFNLADLDAAATDTSTLLHELNAYPLGASRRVVVVRQRQSPVPVFYSAPCFYCQHIPRL